MCLAIPARILELLPGKRAKVDLAGVVREVSVHPLPDVEVGEYVFLYLGVAIERLSQEVAHETLSLWGELAAAMASEPGGRDERMGEAT